MATTKERKTANFTIVTVAFPYHLFRLQKTRTDVLRWRADQNEGLRLVPIDEGEPFYKLECAAPRTIVPNAVDAIFHIEQILVSVFQECGSVANIWVATPNFCFAHARRSNTTASPDRENSKKHKNG